MGFIIRRKSQSDWEFSWKVIIEGCLCGAFLAIVGEALGRWMNWHWIAITALALSPLIWPVFRFLWMRNSRVSTQSIVQFANCYCFGLLGAIAAVAGVYLLLGAGRQTPAILTGALFLVCFLGELLHAVLTIIVILVGGLILSTASEDGEHDDPCCPNCSYCLTGVQSMRCPECGNAFTFEELGMTKATFTARSIETPQ